MKSDVFLSYSNADRSSADALCHHLEGCGIRCWIAPRDVPAGLDWPDAISEAIHAATVFVVVFTTDTANSRHVKSEVRQAFDSEKVIVPIRLAPVKPVGGYDHLLGSSHWIDAFPDGLDCHADNIVRTIRAILNHDVAAGTLMNHLKPAHGSANISNPPPKEFLYGKWECTKMELGQEVRILWSINSDNTTTYLSYVAGRAAYIPSSHWSYADGLLYEDFETGTTGRSVVKALDANSFELTIVDNDSLPYRGAKRMYKRVAMGAEQDAPLDKDSAALHPRH